MEPASPVSLPGLWTRNVLVALAINFCLFFGMQMLTPTLPLYIVGMGGTEPDVGLSVGTFVGAAVVVRLLIGSAGDRWGLKRVLFGFGALFAACGMCYPLVPGIGPLLVLRALHGAGWALAALVPSTIVAEETPTRLRGQAIGFIGLSTNLSSALAPLLGLSLMTGFGFGVMFVTAACISILALLFGVFLKSGPVRSPPESHVPRQLLPRYAV